MLLSFELTMPNIGSHNGKWSGQSKRYFLHKNVPKETADKVLEGKDKRSFHYNFGDGWSACVTAKPVTAIEKRKEAKMSQGFCGYDWMVISILEHNKILVDKPLVPLDCMVCEKEFMGKEPQMCCDGRDCCCMGLPLDPIVCSKECHDKLMKKDNGAQQALWKIMDEIDRLDEEATDIAEKEVERMAREILKGDNELDEFVMAMGTYYFSFKNKRRNFLSNDSNLDERRLKRSTKALFEELIKFMNEYDEKFGLSSLGIRFTAEGETITDW